MASHRDRPPAEWSPSGDERLNAVAPDSISTDQSAQSRTPGSQRVLTLAPGLTIGSYRLIEPAGAGGMAEVWRAYHPRLERFVAVKFLSPRFATDPSYLERFVREARAVSRLDHPNILTVLDFGEQNGWTYMVSPFIGGGTL